LTRVFLVQLPALTKSDTEISPIISTKVVQRLVQRIGTK
jgi:hypothetical protein